MMHVGNDTQRDRNGGVNVRGVALVCALPVAATTVTSIHVLDRRRNPLLDDPPRAAAPLDRLDRADAAAATPLSHGVPSP
jgi:hypothetical protein